MGFQCAKGFFSFEQAIPSANLGRIHIARLDQAFVAQLAKTTAATPI
jgi:hypothetical protein